MRRKRDKKSTEELIQTNDATEDDSNNANSSKPSSTPYGYSDQVEIDNTKPENVMGMWGKTVKTKKIGNSTLMSFRMIQNQAEAVKERIAKAKQQAEGEEDSDQESIKGIEEIRETAPVGLDNSAAALFGFGGGAGTSSAQAKSEPVNFDNSAAALFGFGKAHESSSSIDLQKAAELAPDGQRWLTRQQALNDFGGKC